MADQVTARDRGAGEKRVVIPEMQSQGVLVDVIDLGERVTQFKNEEPYLQQRVALVYQSAEVEPTSGRRYEVYKEFTNSMGKKANLRAFVEGWRGKRLTVEEARKGINLAALVGANGLMSTEHLISRSTGEPYAVIAAMAPLPKTMAKIMPVGYERAPWWSSRKEEYAVSAAAFKAQRPAQSQPSNDFEATATALEDEDDDLPF